MCWTNCGSGAFQGSWSWLSSLPNFPWVHPELTSHLDVFVGQVEPSSCLDPVIVIPRELLLPMAMPLMIMRLLNGPETHPGPHQVGEPFHHLEPSPKCLQDWGGLQGTPGDSRGRTWQQIARRVEPDGWKSCA